MNSSKFVNTRKHGTCLYQSLAVSAVPAHPRDGYKFGATWGVRVRGGGGHFL